MIVAMDQRQKEEERGCVGSPFQRLAPRWHAMRCCCCWWCARAEYIGDKKPPNNFLAHQLTNWLGRAGRHSTSGDGAVLLQRGTPGWNVRPYLPPGTCTSTRLEGFRSRGPAVEYLFGTTRRPLASTPSRHVCLGPNLSDCVPKARRGVHTPQGKQKEHQIRSSLDGKEKGREPIREDQRIPMTAHTPPPPTALCSPNQG